MGDQQATIRIVKQHVSNDGWAYVAFIIGYEGRRFPWFVYRFPLLEGGTGQELGRGVEDFLQDARRAVLTQFARVTKP
jgi:hypothetical protein